MSDNHVLPFQIDKTNFRGRLVRLGSAIDEILSLHQYPETIAKILGEAIGLTACLSATLKFDGVLSLQASGDGILKVLVADVTSDGHLRGYAQFDEEKVAKISESASFADILGTGYLALTLDQGENMQRYQGMVEIVGSTLTDCIQHYFKQSEQLETGFKVSCLYDETSKAWRAGTLMLQKMPEEGGKSESLGNTDEDAWRRVMVLMSSTTDHELTSFDLTSEELLFRLFHEDGVRVHEERPLSRQCRCSKERIVTVLKSLPVEDLDSLEKDGMVEVKCQFCSSEYRFTMDEIAEIRAEKITQKESQ